MVINPNIEKSSISSEDDLYNQYFTTNDDDVVEDLAMVTPTMLTPQNSMCSVDQGRRLSRTSIQWFQNETNLTVGPLPPQSVHSNRRNSGLIGHDGKLRDDFIAKRQSINKIKEGKLALIPKLVDLTTELTKVDGWTLTQLLVSGFAKMSSKTDELNKINVFPIADGDTGANMKICLKLPTRNLLMDPSESVATVTCNMAADVLLNGQGNSGTILSHFFVSLAEAVKHTGKDTLTLDEFAQVISHAGQKMEEAVPNPVEGTLLSVCRDACHQLVNHVPFANLKELLEVWNNLAQEELKKTPDRLIVDGVKVLEKAGVVDSGAQGFVYCIEGMYLASLGQLPEAFDTTLFQTAEIPSGEDVSLDVDHTVTETEYQFCTEGVILLKDGLTHKDVLEALSGQTELGDSVVCVGAPAKEGGNMAKVHIHSNNPEAVFQKLREFSRDSILKKEKVEDMKAMRIHAHEENIMFNLEEPKFTIMGMCGMILPPMAKSDEHFTLPVFMVPSTTQEPIDIRFASDSEACNALNCQRHKSTAIRYTTATSNPMQIKIELLAALAKGLPILLFLMSKDKRVSALGRNVMVAISMLKPEQQEQVKVLVHGWGFHETLFLLEAIKYAKEGKTIEEAHAACQQLVDRNFVFATFVSSPTVKKLLAWRPGLFPAGFSVEDGQFSAFGIDPVVREGEPLNELQKVGMLCKVKTTASSLEELESLEIERIKSHLKPGQKLENLIISCVGRPDYGHHFVRKLRDAAVPLANEPIVYNSGFFSLATSSWGEYTLQYKIV